MADRLTAEQRRLNMSRIRARNTAPELAVRRILHSHGYRYRLHGRDLPGRPDIILPRYRTVIMVHGCFWHGHGCSLFKVPATRTEFWTEKIETNRSRDRQSLADLQDLGWRTLTVWECSLKGRLRLAEEELTRQIIAFVVGNELAADIAEAGNGTGGHQS